MKSKSFYLLALALLLRTSSAQSFSATDTKGQFKRIFHSRSGCPRTIVHHEVLDTDQDSYYRIPHEEISQEGVGCSPGGNFLIMNDDHYESTMRAAIPMSVRQASGADILSALYGMQSPVLIGVERDARVCGDTGFPPETSFLFFRYDGITTLQDLPTVEEGTVIMVSFEDNPDQPCIYATKNALAVAPLSEEDIPPIEDERPIDSISSVEVDLVEEEESSPVTAATSATSGVTVSTATSDDDTEVPEEKPSPVSAAPPPPDALVGPEPVEDNEASPVSAAAPSTDTDPNPSTIPPLPVTDDSQADVSPSAKRRNPAESQAAATTQVTGPTVQAEPPVTVSGGSVNGNTNDNEAETGNDGSVSPAPQKIYPSPTPADGGFIEAPVESSESGFDSLESGSCFPSDAKALLPDGSSVRLDELKVGQMVAVGGGEFSQVIAFTHADKSSTPEFIQLTTACGKSVRATPGHLINVNTKELVPMKSVRIGDTISLSMDEYAEVLDIDVTLGSGLFNPQTASGNILVDEVIMSTYTEAINHITAHSLLSPIRMAWKIKNTLSTQRNLPWQHTNLKTYAGSIPVALRLYGISFTTGT